MGNSSVHILSNIIIAVKTLIVKVRIPILYRLQPVLHLHSGNYAQLSIDKMASSRYDIRVAIYYQAAYAAQEGAYIL
jgi:hypothetical protein